MAQAQESTIYYDGKPIPASSMPLQDGYCSNEFILDHEQIENVNYTYKPIGDAYAEERLRDLMKPGDAEPEKKDYFLKAKKAAEGDETIREKILYIEDDRLRGTQTAQIDDRFRELIKDKRLPFRHLVDLDLFGEYDSHMLQHLVFRYTRRTVGPPVKFVLAEDRPGM
ncbi:MAG: hypothetical protein Q9195_006836 [Heterodermia aff. obscurata]